ncbi:Orotate phosphoribosyltransferase [Buchnera aphidicola (Eriosoma grossulariae)]|uniref:orotate phosphoribosyltransferase n=1 Tax=Buchnera aphidicola TaxID=9 RepID=UPI0034638882
MLDFKKEFIDFSLKKKALQFGNFKLKSGRISPYFFDTGSFYTGNDIKKIGYFYAKLIINNNINFDSLLGLAYKGIPIVVSTCISLKKNYNLNIPYSFNRKEKKKYGQYDEIVGYYPKKNVVLIDDVITAGTAICNAVEQIKLKIKNKIIITATIVALNRNEIGYNNISSIKEIKNRYFFPIFSIITIQDVIKFMIEEKKISLNIKKLINYTKKYGVK